MFTDVFFQTPDQKLAELASKHVDVYNYVFTHKSENTLCQIFGLPDKSLAPIHGDDLLFIFSDLMELFPGGMKFNEQVTLINPGPTEGGVSERVPWNPLISTEGAWNPMGKKEKCIICLIGPIQNIFQGVFLCSIYAWVFIFF